MTAIGTDRPVDCAAPIPSGYRGTFTVPGGRRRGLLDPYRSCASAADSHATQHPPAAGVKALTDSRGLRPRHRNTGLHVRSELDKHVTTDDSLRPMPARIYVYCRRADVCLDPEAMLEAIKIADLMTLAEDLNLPEGEEAAVRAIWPHLRVVRAGGMVEVYWKPDGRPIQVEVVHGDQAATYIDALLVEELPPSDEPGAHRVRAHLRETQAIVFMQMGVADSHHLGATIGEVLAFFFAETAGGLVWFYHRDWASPDDRATNIWTT